MRHNVGMSAALLPLALVWASLGQAPADTAAEAGGQERMHFFRENASQFALYRPDAQQPLPLRPEPVLRYSNPERETGSTDGATFLWLDGTRPVAVISLSIRRPNDNVYYECTSLCATPLDCRRNASSLWAPTPRRAACSRSEFRTRWRLRQAPRSD
ncbi:MAG: hypothetical protein HY000_10175 [Planctomycetes bacterium]|nr:hypothetical protein [Planctomycetota bacterium]